MQKLNLKSFINLLKWLKYNKSLTFRMIYRQLKTRTICRKFHNQWECLAYTQSYGKYIQTGYRCNKCNSVHYEFKINK